MPLFKPSPSARQLFNLAQFLILVLATITVSAGLYIPLYSDEIAVQMLRARFFIEDGLLLNLLPQCHSLLIPMPISWYPGAALNAVLYSGASEIGLRIRGIGFFLAWLSLLWIWAGRHPQTLLSRRNFQTLIISFNMLGVLPFVLVLARSEQLLVLALIAYCMLPLFWGSNTADRIYVNLLKVVLFLSITSVFFMAHPKALFFAPVVLVSAWLTFKKSHVFLKCGILATIFFIIFQSLQYAKNLSSCPNAPLMAQTLAQHTLNLKIATSDPLLFAKVALHNLFSSLTLILERVPATSTYQSNWLPNINNKSIIPILSSFGNVLRISTLLFILFLLISFLYRLSWQIIRKRIRSETAIGLSIVIGLIGHATMYNVNAWHFYTPGLVIPLLIMLLLLTLDKQTGEADLRRRIAVSVMCYWYLMALASMAILISVVTPQLIKIARLDEHVIPNQPLSTPVFLSKQTGEETLALAAQCGIKDGDERLVVDGETYFKFQHGKAPINILYISDYAFGMDIGSRIPEFLKNLNSSGVISRCEYLPKVLQEKAKIAGKLCCVSKTVWE